MWAGDGKHGGVGLLDEIFLGTEAAGDDHLAVLGERLADRVERFLLRGVDEAAGVDDDEVGAAVRLRGLVAFGAQLGEDALGIDERLRTAERDETDFRAFGNGPPR
jgi:hypothetical protein